MRLRSTIAIAFAALAMLPGAASAQIGVLGGLSLMRGRIQAPYMAGCEEAPRNGAMGLTLHGGVSWREFSATANYFSLGSSDWSERCRLPSPRPDGTHRVRFLGRESAMWGWLYQLHYSPKVVPAFAFVGTGAEFDGREFIVAGAGVRRRAPVSVYAAAELTQILTPYTVRDEVWENGFVVSHTDLSTGESWRKLIALRVGIEYRWQFTGR